MRTAEGVERVLATRVQVGRNRERRFWNDRKSHTGSMGCAGCPEAATCGGLSVLGAAFDCLKYCCGRPGLCDIVCRKNPAEFVARVREVDGFALDNVPRAAKAVHQNLPAVVPILYHGGSRRRRFEVPVVCLPLYGVVRRRRSGTRLSRSSDVADAYRIGRESRLLLTGTGEDIAIERWWGLGRDRRETIRGLRGIGVEMVTTPNFSLFVNRPRWDDLHSMKRIATTHEEFLAEGMRAALHLNARTERDWERWTEYVQAREEVSDVAVEFATGAGRAARLPWHVRHLTELGRNVGRDLGLVVRAAPLEVLPVLSDAFADVIFLDTNAFMKSVHRQRGTVGEDGKVAWCGSPTGRSEPVDELLDHNWAIVRKSVGAALGCARRNGSLG